MAEQPSGTVTFLFTDVEGSTRLWEDHPAEMQAALERHDEILRTAIEDHHGYVFSTAGDAFAAAFARAAMRSSRPRLRNNSSEPNAGRTRPSCRYGWGCTPARPKSAAATISAPS